MNDDNAPFQGPRVNPDWLEQKKRQVVRRDEEVLEHLDELEHWDAKDWSAQMLAKVNAEAAAWAALPCKGLAERVGECSDDYATTCERRQHVMCARHQARKMQELEHERRADMAAAARKRGVPSHLVQVVWERAPADTEARRAIAAAFEAIPKPTIVILQGGVGCGKSCAAALWAIEHGARFITAPALAKVSPYDAAADEIERASGLVIDDLGTEYLDPKGFFLANFDGLMNARQAEQRPTVITTNLKPIDFRRYGVRVIDRIRESGRFKEVGGVSMRRRPRP